MMAKEERAMKSKVCKLKDTPVTSAHSQEGDTSSRETTRTEGSRTVIHEVISTDDGAQNFVMRVIEQIPGK